MTTDDNSKEILKSPATVAKYRINTLVRAQDRLEAAVAAKLPGEVIQPAALVEQPLAEVIPAQVSPSTPALTEVNSAEGQLDIGLIYRDIDAAYKEIPELPEDTFAEAA